MSKQKWLLKLTCTKRSFISFLYAPASLLIYSLSFWLHSYLSESTNLLTCLILSILNWFYCLDFSIFNLTSSFSSCVCIFFLIFSLSSIMCEFFWIVNSSFSEVLILSTSSEPCCLMNWIIWSRIFSAYKSLFDDIF